MSSPKRKFTAADLIPGLTYRVTVPFKDYDEVMHDTGEVWQFVEKNFLPYEDGLSLFIVGNGLKLQIRLQWRIEAQGQLIDNFSDFVDEVRA